MEQSLWVDDGHRYRLELLYGRERDCSLICYLGLTGLIDWASPFRKPNDSVRFIGMSSFFGTW